MTEVRAPYAHLPEWLQYHRAIGFDRVYVYCADPDPTICFMQVAAWCEIGFVYLIHAPEPRQRAAFFADFARHYRAETAWAMVLATHEFLCLPQDETVGPFLDGLPPYWDCVQFNLLPFGTRLQGNDVGALLPRCTHAAAAPTPVLRPLTRSDRITPAGALAMTDDGAWLGWHEYVGDKWNAPLRAFDVLGRINRLYGLGFPTDALTYLADPGVQARILARGVVCHILQPDARRNTEQTAQLAERSTAVPFPHLAAQAARAMADIRRIDAAPANLAIGRPAMQSSVCIFSQGATVASDAAGGVSGFLTGRFQFHTGLEDDPWWMVDLGDLVELHAIHLFNRLDVGEERAARLSLRVSLDGENWREIYRRTDDSRWGLGGTPLVWTASGKAMMRHLRVVLLGHNFLHLDQIEVYGVQRRADEFFL